MIRTMTVLLTLGLFTVSVSGVQAVEKKKTEPTKAQPAAEQAKAKKAEAKPAGSAKQSNRQTYDSFVDQNKNGIDDRKEKGRKKATAKPAPPKVEPKKAASDSTKKKP